MKIKLKYFLMAFLLILLVSIFVVNQGIAEEDENIASGVVLEQGKNEFFVDRPIYVTELISLNPSIESVSYFDSFLNKQIAYVNVFGGIGDNFLMVPDRPYEISVGEELNLVF